MKCSRIIALATALFALPLFIDPLSGAEATTAKEIIDRAEKQMRGDTLISIMEITIKTRRWTRTMKMRSWDNRLLKKSFSEIIAPEKDAGNRFLLLDKTMFHYIPKLQTEMKISPSMMLQSWMGSDFTNDDIVKESSIIDDYTHALDGKKTVAGMECYQVTLTPKPDAAVVWGKIIYYARVTDCLPVRQEFYNEHNVMKKVMTFDGYKEMDGRTLPTRWKMETVGKNDRYTLLELKKIKFNAPIPRETFTLQNLKRK